MLVFPTFSIGTTSLSTYDKEIPFVSPGLPRKLRDCLVLVVIFSTSMPIFYHFRLSYFSYPFMFLQFWQQDVTRAPLQVALPLSEADFSPECFPDEVDRDLGNAVAQSFLRFYDHSLSQSISLEWDRHSYYMDHNHFHWDCSLFKLSATDSICWMSLDNDSCWFLKSPWCFCDE